MEAPERDQPLRIQPEFPDASESSGLASRVREGDREEQGARLRRHMDSTDLVEEVDRASWDEVRPALDKPTVGAAQQLHQSAWVKLLDRTSRRLKR